MKRKTRKITGRYWSDCSANECIDKLGQLEDIEEELGIDLITLFKTEKCLIGQEFEYEASGKKTIKKLYGWGKVTLKSQVNYHLKLTKEELEKKR